MSDNSDIWVNGEFVDPYKRIPELEMRGSELLAERDRFKMMFEDAERNVNGLLDRLADLAARLEKVEAERDQAWRLTEVSHNGNVKLKAQLEAMRASRPQIEAEHDS